MHSYVYILGLKDQENFFKEDKKIFKIGKANIISERISILEKSTGNPFDLELLYFKKCENSDEAYYFETEMKLKFRKNHFNKEFYKFNKETEKLIKENFLEASEINKLKYLEAEKSIRNVDPFFKTGRFYPERKTQGVSLDELRECLLKINRDAFSGKLRYAILMVMFNTGMRTSEICNIRLSHLESNEEEGVYLKFIGMGENEHKIFLPDSVTDAIREYLEERERIHGPLYKDEFLFRSFSNNSGEKLHRSALNFMFKEIFHGKKICPRSARTTFIAQIGKSKSFM